MKSKHKIKIRLNLRQRLLLLLLIAVTAFKLVPGMGMFYTRSIYPVVGTVLSHISGLVPFALGDVFIAGSIAWVIGYPVYAIGYKKTETRRALGHVGEYLLWVYVWFYAAWGLNYSQPNIYRRMHMRPVEVDKEAFRQFAYSYADSLNAAFDRMVTAKDGKAKAHAALELLLKRCDKQQAKAEAAIEKGYEQMGQNARAWGINTPFNHNPKVKTMVFSRLSSMAGVTGSMGPFFCEFTLNADLRPHAYPATYAHEMAHLLGISNEGEANFYSYVVCTTSKDEATRFSGYYHIFVHVIINVRALLGEEEFERFVSGLRPEIMALARNDREYWLALRSVIIDKTQTFFYNLYLKGNNVEEGLKSYSAVIGMIMAWNKQ